MANEQNLKPFEKGDDPRRNTAGRPKGIKNWSTLVRDMLGDEDVFESLLDDLIEKKPGWWSNLPQKNAATAIVAAMVVAAINGNEKAATWLRKTGYGDKLDITSKDKQIKSVTIFDMKSGAVVAPSTVLHEPDEDDDGEGDEP